nr:2Fe-2S iron-sulfur cluster-binding protein [Escherichia coli]
MLLDALIQLKRKISLSFRRSCREGVCSSDGLNMNSKNGLACSPDFGTQPAGQEGCDSPHAAGFYLVIRDLVVRPWDNSMRNMRKLSLTC